LQAGPLLVMAGKLVVDAATDLEGFSAGSDQFDSDITDGRYPRAAIGHDGAYVYSVVVDGRSDSDVGMTLHELGTYMLERLGVVAALNLDGGGSATLVTKDSEDEYRVVNSPMDGYMQPTPGGSREVYSAVIFRKA
jgi:exopolysaccharide biosynthesis protein